MILQEKEPFHIRQILCRGTDIEKSLRNMNEAGVLGRLVPDFGRIVALVQFNMYHHYTVDEHLIQTVGYCKILPMATCIKTILYLVTLWWY